MTADEVDAYLAGLEGPKRTTLEALRRSILAVVPDAEEGISYGMPAFRVDGKVVARRGTKPSPGRAFRWLRFGRYETRGWERLYSARRGAHRVALRTVWKVHHDQACCTSPGPLRF